ncbi:MAG: hypothetical protein RJB62_528 [Pseudomonadota bacterium]|jgi:precorrin-2 dehydrogenase/sirohydrochlorin ferrochelatase
MLPIILSPHSVRVGAAGKGEAFAARLRLLDRGGIVERSVFEGRSPGTDDLKRLDVLFVAGLDESASREMYAAAKAQGVLVNVEDVPKLCDFHVPAQIRRGDLLITVSTGGRSPGLAARMRETLEDMFGDEWEKNLDEVARARARWRASGLAPNDVAERTRAFVTEKGWLEKGAAP